MKPGNYACSKCRLIVAAISVLLCFCRLVVSVHANSDGDNLYQILGVTKTASTKEIKSAYRRKALDTHPDKNKSVSPEEAAQEFHKVVHAFEVLSDTNSRRIYDHGGGSASSQQQQQQHNSHSFRWQFFHGGRGRPIHLKDKFDVKQAQSRVLHVVSLDQLRTIMLDDDDRLERHLLICFFTPNIENIVNDEIVYPYPFAGTNPHQVWWEDLLQTISIRFHRSNDLTRYFNIEGVGGDMTEPTFLFIKRGTKLGETDTFDHRQQQQRGSNNVHSCKDHASFEKWMWGMIEVKVRFFNHHDHPVELYWVHGNTAHIQQTIEPRSSEEHTSMLTHKFYTRDARVDNWHGSPGRWKLTDSTSLGSWKIGVESDEEGCPPMREDGSFVIDIPLKSCIDLSGHCAFWASRNQCSGNPEFMKSKCPFTCNQCGSNFRHGVYRHKNMTNGPSIQQHTKQGERTSHDEL